MTVLFFRVSVSAGIIVNHECLDVERIPDPYLAAVKKMWFNVLGESHSTGYFKGCDLLEADNARFQANNVDGFGVAPEAYTDTRMRISRISRGDVTSPTGWRNGYGEEDFFTSAQAIARTKAHVDYCNANGYAIAVMAFGWCWDMTWHHTVFAETVEDWGGRWGGALDYYNGTSIVRQQIWGITADETPNSPFLSLQDYLLAVEAYIAHCQTQGYATKVIFTTGPVDGSDNSELGLGRHVKYEAIRDYVEASPAKILFDYADILCYDSDGTRHSDLWSGHAYPAIHPENMQDLDGTYAEDGDHIGKKGALKLGKGVWWLLARMADWNGLGVRLKAKIFMEGAFGVGQMTTDLNSGNQIPLTSPYGEDPRSVLSIPVNAVDWVLVQLRTSPEGPVVFSRSAFLRSDGCIVRDDGVTDDIALEVAVGNYYVVIRHRNHLPVMSAAAIPLNTGSPDVYDFTEGSGQYYGSNGAKQIEAGVWGMWAGDVNQDKNVTTSDYTSWYNSARLGESGYKATDINMDGVVTTSDYTQWYNNARLGAASNVP
jgi:hypothetical protein